MRWSILALLGILALVAGQAQPAPIAPPNRPIYTNLVFTTGAPVMRQGNLMVPARRIAEEVGGTATWVAATRAVRVTAPDRPTIELRMGSPVALVDDRVVTLDAAPFTADGVAMAPLRFLAQTLGMPIAYDPATRSASLRRGERLYIIPLTDLRAGITIADPRPRALVRSPVLVQGQGNVFEGALIIEVRDRGGRVVGRTIATAGMGAFYAYSARVPYVLPVEDAVEGVIVVYAQDGVGDGQILARAAIQVLLASTR